MIVFLRNLPTTRPSSYTFQGRGFSFLGCSFCPPAANRQEPPDKPGQKQIGKKASNTQNNNPMCFHLNLLLIPLPYHRGGGGVVFLAIVDCHPGFANIISNTNLLFPPHPITPWMYEKYALFSFAPPMDGFVQNNCFIKKLTSHSFSSFEN